MKGFTTYAVRLSLWPGRTLPDHACATSVDALFSRTVVVVRAATITGEQGLAGGVRLAEHRAREPDAEEGIFTRVVAELADDRR